jgi:ATP-dependent Lhr-like helicase
MNAFDLLKEPIKQYIWRLGWRKFYPIQEAAIKHILTTNDNYILSSRTASGKTEAAFLPAINSIENWRDGVKVIYISPLVALINDQFTRIEKLCEHLDIKITKWHGEANITEKQKLIKSPEGIILITPESIEAMFVNHPEQVLQLFKNLEFVIIDEIHSFLGTLRGKHLQSLLQRVHRISNKNVRYIGLSATLSDETYSYAKNYFPSEQITKVLLDNERNELSVSIFYYEAESASLPLELIEDIYNKTQSRKTLIFPNTRGRVEEIAVRLKKLAIEQSGHTNYFAHHSSIDRDLREFVENFAKSSFTQNFAISCTSTLELGIDIGSIDTVVQVDSTFSIASLVQRLGRSGRIDHKSNLLLYATDPWSLLQSIACIELYKEKFIEPINDIHYPLDVLLQQMLSLLKQHSGITESNLVALLINNKAFINVSKDDVLNLIKYLIEIKLIEKTGQELIVGLEGERITNKKDFYSLFDTEDNFKVEFKGKVIGELPLSPQIIGNENIFLGANIWKIKEIDLETKKIFVTVAKDGKKPKFFGSGGEIHLRIRLKMLELILDHQIPVYLDTNAVIALKELRQKFQPKMIENIHLDRPIIQTENRSSFYSFTGSKINRTIFLYSSMFYGEELKYYESESSFEGGTNLRELIQSSKLKACSKEEVTEYLTKDIAAYPNKYKLGKFAVFLPNEFKAKYLIENYYALPEANEYLKRLRIV